MSVAALQLSDTSTSTELGNKSVIGRGLFIMETLSHSSNGMSYAEISRATELPKSTVHRIVGQLIDLGLVARSRGGFILGLRVFEWGSKAGGNVPLRQAAMPQLVALSNEFGETVHLGVLDGNDVVYLEKLEPNTGVKCPTQVGDRLRADKTALGKTMLAFKQGIGQKDAPFSIEREETFRGLCCIASPILDRRLRPVGAISISVPIDRFTVEKFAPQVRLAAERTARQLLGTTRQEQH